MYVHLHCKLPTATIIIVYNIISVYAADRWLYCTRVVVNKLLQLNIF